MQISFRTMAASILFAAGFIVQQSLDQTAQVPAGRAGGVIASKLPDAEGVHLGMSVVEATAVMKGLFPGAGLQVLYSHYLNGPPFVSSMKGQSQDQTDDRRARKCAVRHHHGRTYGQQHSLRSYG